MQRINIISIIRKKHLTNIVLWLSVCFPLLATANEHGLGCGIFQASTALHQLYTPEQQRRYQWNNHLLEQRAKQLATTRKSNGTDTQAPLNITIPVAVHVVHANGEENISSSQIIDAIDQLTEDFHAVPTAGSIDGFGHLQANIGYTFKLAKRDPQGNPTNGITRTYNPTWSYKGDDIAMKRAVGWPQHMYLNIYVVYSAYGGNSSGFAYYPSQVEPPYEAWDGIVASHWAVGRTGTARSTHYKLLTHEVGHWANLRHAWGEAKFQTQAGCGDDDFVSDTPNCWGAQYCSAQRSCGSADNTENFMDYGTCTTMFTFGQSDRMNAAMQSAVAKRNYIWSHQNLRDTGLSADPSNQKPVAKANGPYQGAVGEALTFYSTGSVDPDGSIASYRWDFGDGQFSLEPEPTHSYSAANTYPVTLTVTDGQGATGVDTTTATIGDSSHCKYTLRPSSASHPASGGSGTVSVTASSTCSWAASSNASWLQVTQGSSGKGDGTVSYLLTHNSTSSSRTGVITIGGQRFTVTQAAGASPDCTTYHGQLSGAGQFEYQPNGNWYHSPNSGSHTGKLSGPANADYNLELLLSTSSGWTAVARSSGPGSQKQVQYDGSPGYYIWKVISDNGQGNYSVCISTP